MEAERGSRVRNGQGRVMVLQALSDIRTGITAGQSSKTLFDQLKARLAGMSYRQFCRYVDRIRQGTPNPDVQLLQPKRTASFALPEAAAPSPAPASASSAEAPRTAAEASTPHPPQEKNDGPKAPPRPRGFVRRPGLPDDNKDQLI